MCDAEGNIYTRNWNHQELYILDREGRLLMEYKGGDATIEDPLRMLSGELLFPIKNIEDQSSQLVLFDPEQKKTHTVSSFETYPINSVYGIQGSNVYYEAWEGIVRWNIVSGDRTLVYRFSQNERLFRTMLVLLNQDYLMDLGSVLSELFFSRALPAVIEMGTVNDTLVGLAPAISTYSAVTLKDIWDQAAAYGQNL